LINNFDIFDQFDLFIISPFSCTNILDSLKEPTRIFACLLIVSFCITLF